MFFVFFVDALGTTSSAAFMYLLKTSSEKVRGLISTTLFSSCFFYVFSVRLVERKKAAVKRCEDQLLKMEVQATDREENKQIALGTSKLNYLDPRISVAWWVDTNTLTTSIVII